MAQPTPGGDIETLEQLQTLEERIVHTIRLLTQTRQARQEADTEAAQLRAELAARDAELASLHRQLAEAHKEREVVRRRVEKLLRQMDALTGEGTGG